MEKKYSQNINFLHELVVQQIDLVCLPKDHKQTGNSCGLQAAAIVAWGVRGDGGDTEDNGPGVGPLTGARAGAAPAALPDGTAPSITM